MSKRERERERSGGLPVCMLPYLYVTKRRARYVNNYRVLPTTC